jgi:hypothetical protein
LRRLIWETHSNGLESEGAWAAVQTGRLKRQKRRATKLPVALRL